MSSAQKTKDKMMKIFDFIKSYSLKSGYPPSIREICAEMKISSTATAAYYLDKLEQYGYIKKYPNRNRAMEILYDNNNDISSYCPKTVSAPLINKYDKESFNENIKHKYIIPTSLFNISNEGNFILKADNKNLLNDSINENDLILINRQSNINENDLILIDIDNQNFICKCLMKDNKKYIVINNQEIDLNEQNTIGKVISIIRNF